MSTEVLWDEIVPGGSNWSHVLKRGTALRLTDVEGEANVSAIFLNFEIPAERYNFADTLKAQHTARLTRGHVLMTDMGRVLCSIVEDTVGWHDPIGGHSSAATIRARYGEKRYQEHRNSFYRNARDLFLIDLEKHGLTPESLMAGVNFFSRVDVDAEGRMSFHPGNSKPGGQVVLRAEMNTLVILNTCPHPLNPAPEYPRKPVHLSIERAAPPGPDDYCRNFRPENGRAFTLTERYFL